MIFKIVFFVIFAFITIILKIFNISEMFFGNQLSINDKEAKDKIKNGYFDHIIDVRTNEEWYSGHYPGAKHIPLAKIKSNLENAMQWIEKDHKILVYCKSGRRSGIAAELLDQAGYVNVKSLVGNYTSIV